MFPSAPVSTLHQRLALFFDATGISTVAKASVIASMESLWGWSSLSPLVSSGRLVSMYHDFIKSRVSFWNSYLICLFLPPCCHWGCDLGFMWASLALLDFCTSISSDKSSGKSGRWSPLLGSALSLACGILCSCHMGSYVLMGFFVIFCNALTALLIGPLKTCLSAIVMCMWHTAAFQQ